MTAFNEIFGDSPVIRTRTDGLSQQILFYMSTRPDFDFSTFDFELKNELQYGCYGQGLYQKLKYVFFNFLYYLSRNDRLTR